jgi:hypothetical protein
MPPPTTSIVTLQNSNSNHALKDAKSRFRGQTAGSCLEVRPHQGLGNVILPRPGGGPVGAVDDDDCTSPLRDLAEVKCEQRLGGLLKHFYRQAA